MRFLIAFILSVISSYAVSENEMVAAVIIGEAGGEGEAGMQAVANVIANRTTKNRTAADVINRKWQFSCVNQITVEKAETWDEYVDRKRKHSRWKVALDYAQRIQQLPDITGGATHYHTPAVNPKWAKILAFKKRIGNHLFYREGA